MKILAIDDSNTIRLLMVKMLRELGYSDLTIAAWCRGSNSSCC